MWANVDIVSRAARQDYITMTAYAVQRACRWTDHIGGVTIVRVSEAERQHQAFRPRVVVDD